MQVAAGEDDEAAVQGPRVLAGLLLADQRVFVFGFGFQNDEREAFGIEQQEINKALAGLFEIITERVQIGRLEGDAGFQSNIRGRVAFGKETPASRFEQLIDLDAGGGFLHFLCNWSRLALRAEFSFSPIGRISCALLTMRGPGNLPRLARGIVDEGSFQAYSCRLGLSVPFSREFAKRRTAVEGLL